MTWTSSRQAVRVGGGAGDAGAGRLDDLGHAVDVVVVMVRQQDLVQGPAAAVQFGKDRRGLGRVHQDRLPAALHEIGVVVAEAADRHQFGHGLSFRLRH